jgi:hypothetical protein
VNIAIGTRNRRGKRNTFSFGLIVNALHPVPFPVEEEEALGRALDPK